MREEKLLSALLIFLPHTHIHLSSWSFHLIRWNDVLFQLLHKRQTANTNTLPLLKNQMGEEKQKEKEESNAKENRIYISDHISQIQGIQRIQTNSKDSYSCFDYLTSLCFIF